MEDNRGERGRSIGKRIIRKEHSKLSPSYQTSLNENRECPSLCHICCSDEQLVKHGWEPDDRENQKS